MLDGNADVVVCDGFAGNVLLKSIEGTAKVVFDDIRRAAADASDTERHSLRHLLADLSQSLITTMKAEQFFLELRNRLSKDMELQRIKQCIIQLRLLMDLQRIILWRR